MPLNVAESRYWNSPGLLSSKVAEESQDRLPVSPQKLPAHPPTVAVRSQWIFRVGSVRTPSGPSVVPSHTWQIVLVSLPILKRRRSPAASVNLTTPPEGWKQPYWPVGASNEVVWNRNRPLTRPAPRYPSWDVSAYFPRIA